jgi:hypothetical protein
MPYKAAGERLARWAEGTEGKKGWGGERLLQPGRRPSLGEPTPLRDAHVEARQRCEADKPHAGGRRTTGGPKKRRTLGANQARRPNHMPAEGPGVHPAKGTALVISAGPLDPPDDLEFEHRTYFLIAEFFIVSIFIR